MLPGDHACYVYAADLERRRVLRGYLRGGLDASQRVAYLSGERPEATEAWLCADDRRLRRGVASGQLLLVATAGAAPGGHAAGAERTLSSLQVMADEAMTDGYPALRLAAEGAYLTEGLTPASLAPFEDGFTRLVEANRMLALCMYSAERMAAVALRGAVAGHPPGPDPGVYGGPGLRITRTSLPPGIRLAGELDRQHLPAFTEALAGLVESAETIRIDMRSLTFIDVAAVTAIANTAKELDDGRQVVLDSPPSMAGRILAKCWQGIPLPRLAICTPRAALGTTWTAAFAGTEQMA